MRQFLWNELMETLEVLGGWKGIGVIFLLVTALHVILHVGIYLGRQRMEKHVEEGRETGARLKLRSD